MKIGIYYKIYFSMVIKRLPHGNFYKNRSISTLTFDFVGFTGDFSALFASFFDSFDHNFKSFDACILLVDGFQYVPRSKFS